MTCSKCNKDFSIENFHSSGNGKFHKQCKYCKRIAIKDHYEKNKNDYIARAKVKNAEIKQEIIKLIRTTKNRPCKDCGKIYPHYVMDFDHRYDKVKNIADMKSCGSLNKVKKEIEKCDVVCSNCHRERTHNPSSRT